MENDLVQAGAIGLCAMLIVLVSKLVSDFRKTTDKSTEAIISLTSVIVSIKVLIEERLPR